MSVMSGVELSERTSERRLHRIRELKKVNSELTERILTAKDQEKHAFTVKLEV
jgi:hypothetical protein